MDQENLQNEVRKWQSQNPEDNFQLTLANEETVAEETDLHQIENVDQDDDDEVCPCIPSAAKTSFFFCH